MLEGKVVVDFRVAGVSRFLREGVVMKVVGMMKNGAAAVAALAVSASAFAQTTAPAGVDLKQMTDLINFDMTKVAIMAAGTAIIGLIVVVAGAGTIIGMVRSKAK